MLRADDAVRNELMEQLPAIVRLCHPITHFSTISIFLPVIVRYLTDSSSQVVLCFDMYAVNLLLPYCCTVTATSLLHAALLCEFSCNAVMSWISDVMDVSDLWCPATT